MTDRLPQISTLPALNAFGSSESKINYVYRGLSIKGITILESFCAVQIHIILCGSCQRIIIIIYSLFVVLVAPGTVPGIFSPAKLLLGTRKRLRNDAPPIVFLLAQATYLWADNFP